MDVADLERIADHCLITPDQERELARRIQAGDQDALRELTCANLRLVISIAGKLAMPSFPIEDCISEGYLGLLRAAELFDPDKYNTRFSTFATYQIRAKILRARFEKSKVIRTPIYLQQLTSAFLRGEELAPTQREYVRRSLAIRYHTQSLTHSEHGREPPPELAIEADETAMEADDRAHWVHQLLAYLAPYDRKMIQLRYGLDGPPHTLRELGQKHRISKERVRQILDAALDELRIISEHHRVKIGRPRTIGTD